MARADRFKLLFMIVLAEGAGVLGAAFTSPAIPGWYAGLAKPALTPPGAVFGPVWTILYLLMGIAAFLVWRKGARTSFVRTALACYGIQLVLNVAWSAVFFGMHDPFGAFLTIILLWLAILATMIAFARVSRAACWLLVPYLAWVSFAAYLNWGIFMLNF